MKRTQKLLCMGLFSKKLNGPLLTGQPTGPSVYRTVDRGPAAKESASAAPLIVLGYDENHKPRAARFPAKDADLVTKAAQLMDLRVYEAA